MTGFTFVFCVFAERKTVTQEKVIDLIDQFYSHFRNHAFGFRSFTVFAGIFLYCLPVGRNQSKGDLFNVNLKLTNHVQVWDSDTRGEDPSCLQRP